MSNAIIQVKNLTAKYGNLLILDDVSFEVNPGEIFFVIGGSGIGKTTLINHMIGLLKPVSGSVFIDEENLTTATENKHAKISKKIGVMYQSGALFGSMNLLENISLPLEELTDLPKEAIQIIAKNKLKLVGLENFSHYMPAEISGGMRKRAAIARAMALDPKILFLDEPSSGLDPIISTNLDQLIQQLSKQLGITFVIVSHELASIYQIAERVIMIQDAKIIASGKPKTLRDQCDNVFVKNFLNREA